MKAKRCVILTVVLVIVLVVVAACVCWLRVPGSRIVSRVDTSRTDVVYTCQRTVMNGGEEGETSAISLTAEQVDGVLAQLKGKTFWRMDSACLPYASEVRYTFSAQDTNGQPCWELECQGTDWIRGRTYTDDGAEKDALSVKLNGGMASEWAASLETLFEA